MVQRHYGSEVLKYFIEPMLAFPNAVEPSAMLASCSTAISTAGHLALSNAVKCCARYAYHPHYLDVEKRRQGWWPLPTCNSVHHSSDHGRNVPRETRMDWLNHRNRFFNFDAGTTSYASFPELADSLNKII